MRRKRSIETREQDKRRGEHKQQLADLPVRNNHAVRVKGGRIQRRDGVAVKMPR